MGYSKSESAVERVKPLLDQMVAATTDLTWHHKNPHMLGYHLREAMTIAKRHKLEPYNTLKERFIIRNKGDKVVAEIRHFEALPALQAAMSKVVLEDITSLVSIVGAAIDNKAHELYFPSAILSDEDKLTLYTWCVKNEYFMIVAEVGVTITKSDPGDVAWAP